MKATIVSVFPEPRKWNSDKYPDACSVEGLFEGGAKWEYATKNAKAPEILRTLTGFVGQEQDYDMEDRGQYQGQKQYKLKSWPGKPEGGKQGGFGTGYKQSFEALWYEQERMDRRTALMQTVAWLGPVEAGDGVQDVIRNSDIFYDWLRATEKKPIATETAPKPQNIQSMAKPATTPQNSPQTARCPICNIEGGGHFSDCEYAALAK